MENQALAYALFTALGSALTLLVNAVTERLRAKARRTDAVYNKRVERFLELEELAGHLTEYLGSYKGLEPEFENLRSEYRQIERMSGSFRRYGRVTRAVRGFLHRAGLLLSEGGRTQFESRERADEAVGDLDEAFDELTDAIDAELDSHGVYDLR